MPHMQRAGLRAGICMSSHLLEMKIIHLDSKMLTYSLSPIAHAVTYEEFSPRTIYTRTIHSINAQTLSLSDIHICKMLFSINCWCNRVIRALHSYGTCLVSSLDCWGFSVWHSVTQVTFIHFTELVKRFVLCLLFKISYILGAACEVQR